MFWLILIIEVVASVLVYIYFSVTDIEGVG